MALIDILIYVFFAISMYVFAKQSWHYSSTNINTSNILICCYILFFTLISAIRWDVGADCRSYIKTFITGNYECSPSELLWIYLVKFIHYNKLHFSVGLGIAAFFQIFFLYNGLKKYRYILLMLPIVLFGGKYFLDMSNAIRQMIVACIFVWATKYIVERKLLKYLLIIVCSSFIHSSAIILIVFYFIPFNFDLANKRTFSLALFLFFFIIEQFGHLLTNSTYISTISNLIGYDKYGEFINERLYSGNFSESLSFGPTMLSFFIISLFLIWFAPIMSKTYSSTIPSFNLWYNLSYYYSCSYFLVCNISHILIRPTMYLEPFQMIFCALLLFFFKHSKKYNILYYVFISIIWVFIVWGILKVTPGSHDITTFKFFFNYQDVVL